MADYPDLQTTEEGREFEKAIDQFLSAEKRDYPSYYGGLKVASGVEFIIHSPIDESIRYGIFQEPEEGIMEAAVEATLKAYGEWSKVPMAERAAYFEKYLALLKARRMYYAAMVTVSTGMVRQDALLEVDTLIAAIEGILEEAKTFRGSPVGVWAIISAHNSPMASPIAFAIAALVAGNTVVMNPSNTCPMPAYSFYEAMERYGTSAGASRLVAGERPIQRELEKALAEVYGTEDCVVFVSGHATNVSTISTLFGPKDLIVHDSQIHNSIVEGCRLSCATRHPFPHNDLVALDQFLSSNRRRFERVLIVVEGHYSMDGDIVDLPTLVAMKKRFGAFLMVDEAHGLGVLGAHGKGLAEHFGVDGGQVDIWMGTLSKTLATCGGYIAGSRALVDILKFAAPGFVYSVGISPPLAAASLRALQIMLAESERVQRLHENTQLFLSLAKNAGLATGTSEGFAIVPVIVGSSRKAITISNALFEHGINVQPIIHPAVEEKSARLRFFISCDHEENDIRHTVQILASLVRGTSYSSKGLEHETSSTSLHS